MACRLLSYGLSTQGMSVRLSALLQKYVDVAMKLRYLSAALSSFRMTVVATDRSTAISTYFYVN
jgi:hypothetical protein